MGFADDYLIVETDVMAIAYEKHGPSSGRPVVLLHGFPYDVRAYDAVVPALVDAGMSVYVPWLRGFGPTGFLNPSETRSGEQAAIASDLGAFIRRLGLDSPILAGFDWGCRAAIATAALWPDLVGGLVAIGGYSVQDIARAAQPQRPEDERKRWYAYFLLTERGRAALTNDRRQLCSALWSEWSPELVWDDAEFAKTAKSFDNPDFVDVVVHSYRHRFGVASGASGYSATESVLASRPTVTATTIVLRASQGALGYRALHSSNEQFFTNLVDVVGLDCGHYVPREAPAEVALAILRIAELTTA